MSTQVPDWFEYVQSVLPQKEHVQLLQKHGANSVMCKFRGLQFTTSRQFQECQVSRKDKWVPEKRWVFSVNLEQPMIHDDIFKIFMKHLLKNGGHPLATEDPVTA